MSSTRDDWEKPRSKGTHLTDAEIEMLRAAFRVGRSARDVARDLKCSSRVANKYYSYFKAQGETKNNRSISLRLPQRMDGSEIAPPSKARLMGGR